MIIRILKGLVALIILLIIIGAIKGCEAEMPDNLGITNNQLQPCPSSPNCMSTQATEKSQKMEPIRYATSQVEAQQDILKVVQSMKGTKVISSEKGYMHVTFTTAVFRFIDDVEFYFDDEKSLIHFRSASRLGHSDLGVNRRRMEKVVEAYGKLQ